MIQTQELMGELVSRLAGVPRIGVDTEADSLHSYREKLCLIQISTRDEDALVDPLAGLDLQPLLDVFSSSEIVLQGADFDLRMLRTAGTLKPGRVFDTTLAARLIGLTEIGLAAMVQSFFGVELPKGSQKADWGKRPLPAKMLEYAVNDTRYLLELADKLEARLRELGRYGWFEEWCNRVRDGAMRDREQDPDAAWKIKGAHALSPRAQAMLKVLWKWRDAEAERADRPAFHILRNDLLLSCSRELELNGVADTAHLRGSKLGRFQQACAEALALTEASWPRREYRPREKPTKDFYEKVDALKAVRDKAAAGLELDPSILAPRAALEAIAKDASRTGEVLMSWQMELLNLKPSPASQAAQPELPVRAGSPPL